MITLSGVELRAGQIWKEVDPRFLREFEIVSFDTTSVRLRGLATNRVTSAQLRRFNGKRSGYEFVREAP